MSNFLAGAIGALLGLAGVALGGWLQRRGEHQRWLRDQKLQAAIGFIGATGAIYDRRRRVEAALPTATSQGTDWARAQDARSALYLLCDEATIEVAEALIKRVRSLQPATDGSPDEEAISLLRELVRRLRTELGAGLGK
ncbi:hypothetical protein [Micromonospora chersina]|uniref:hypothetical protein n=1 Tax=Micromonospora chersina TaxID=47854 RepID=UPI000B8A0CA5|nr:hypothetical protein [Micromonospora chersina]